MDYQGRKQTWLAKECRVSRNFMNIVLNGGRMPSNATWKLMALALGVPEESLAKGATRAKAS